MPKYSQKAQDKVERAMHERKHGTLKSGRSGKKVTSRKQAIAIGLSEAREEGAKVPQAKGAKKSTGGRKSASRSKSATKSSSSQLDHGMLNFAATAWERIRVRRLWVPRRSGTGNARPGFGCARGRWRAPRRHAASVGRGAGAARCRARCRSLPGQKYVRRQLYGDRAQAAPIQRRLRRANRRSRSARRSGVPTSIHKPS